LDCFGDSSSIGHEATDIETGRCTWLAVVALQRATPAQKKLMQVRKIKIHNIRNQSKVHLEHYEPFLIFLLIS